MEAFLDNSRGFISQSAQLFSIDQGLKPTARLYALPRPEMACDSTAPERITLSSPVRKLPHKRPQPRDKDVVMMSVVIAKDHFRQLQQIIFSIGGGDVTVLRSEPIPRSDALRVWLNSGRHAMDGLMSAIMRGLPGGEFGRIVPA